MGYKFAPIAPSYKAVAITTSDATVIPVTRGIYVGGAGNLTVRMEDGQTVLFTAVAVGVILPIAVDMVLATGTTATALVAVY
jgi:hypothetical protein